MSAEYDRFDVAFSQRNYLEEYITHLIHRMMLGAETDVDLIRCLNQVTLIHQRMAKVDEELLLRDVLRVMDSFIDHVHATYEEHVPLVSELIQVFLDAYVEKNEKTTFQ